MLIQLAQISSGDTAWVLMGILAVFIMTPGLALFYGGLLRKKSVLGMFALVFVSIAITTIAWVIIAYSIAFGEDVGGIGLFGNPIDFLGMDNVDSSDLVGNIPLTVFIMFQLMFAIITAAILASPFAERAKFDSFMVLIFFWIILVYAPLVHWIWGGGWLQNLGFLDFAGGAVVHISVGISALAIALVIKNRSDYNTFEGRPHNIPMVLLGLGLLWFGWFGFNGASALAANGVAGMAILNTNLSASMAMLTWIFLEYRDKDKRKPSLIGSATGALAGLATITPGAAYVKPWAAILIGIIASLIIYRVLRWRANSNLDESLDAFSCHGVGGITGIILTGVFGNINGATSLITGDIGQLGIQILGALVVAVFSFGLTYLIAFIVKKMMKLRVSETAEYVGVDITEHGELAYNPM